MADPNEKKRTDAPSAPQVSDDYGDHEESLANYYDEVADEPGPVDHEYQDDHWQ